MNYYIEKYYPFSSDEIPAEKIFTIDTVDYSLFVDYNSIGDFYTIQISDSDGNVLLTNKLSTLTAVNDCIINGLTIPNRIIPINYERPDDTRQVNESTFTDFQLYLLEGSA